MGARSQQKGAGFEQRLIDQLAALKAQGKADVQRRKPPYNRCPGKPGKDGSFRVWPAKKASVDFDGSIAPDGRAVYFDAKSTQNQTSLPFGIISDGQVSYLQNKARTGALAFLVVARSARAEQAERIYVVPVDKIGRIGGQAHKRSGCDLAESLRESVTWAVLEDAGWRAAAWETWVDVAVRQLDAGAW